MKRLFFYCSNSKLFLTVAHQFTNTMVSERLFIAFDSLTILISFADVVTDVFVLYEWYINGHYGYFYTSLSILILANISYFIMFWIKMFKYCGGDYPCDKFNVAGNIFVILFSTIFSFLLPYIIYFYESPHFFKDTSEYLQEYLDLTASVNVLPQQLLDAIKSMDENFDDLKVKAILNKKLNSHIGFLLETFVESFPQSIIQMIAILQFSASETNPIANIIIVTSIFLSLTSIAFKSIMLLAVPDVMTSIFNWTAAVIDFFAVFVIVSWLFLELEDNENAVTSTQNLQYFTIGNLLITTIPFYGSFLLYLFTVMFDRQSGICFCCCMYIIYFIVLLFGTVMGHIFAGVFVAFYIQKFGLFRFDLKGSEAGPEWSKIFRFIWRSSDNKDRLNKVLITNMIIPYMAGPKKEGNTIDFKEWLNKQSETGFKEVDGFKVWRGYIDRPSFLAQITFSEYGMAQDDYEAMKQWACSCIADTLQHSISYICLPLYLLGRCIHVLFPITVYIINIGLYGWNGVYLLHHVLNLTFIVLLVVILAISYKVMYFTYCIYHIGYWINPPSIGAKTYQRVEDFYVDNIQLPIIIDFFDEEFGEDVSRLIVMYLKAIVLE